MGKPKKVQCRGNQRNPQGSASTSASTSSGKNSSWKDEYIYKDVDLEFVRKLELAGFKSKVIAADGNCLFRSLCDQLHENGDGNHMRLRSDILDFMTLHKSHFELFWDDEEDASFEDYISRMRGDGAWAGNQELFAASEFLNCEITVHVCAPQEGKAYSSSSKKKNKGKNKRDTPASYDASLPAAGADDPLFSYVLRPGVLTEPGGPAKAKARAPAASIHISYHGECHYNSVRSVDDPDEGNAAAAYHSGKNRVAVASPAKKMVNDLDADSGSDVEAGRGAVASVATSMANLKVGSASVASKSDGLGAKIEKGDDDYQHLSLAAASIGIGVGENQGKVDEGRALSHKEKKKEIFLHRKAEAAALGLSKKEHKHLAKRLARTALAAGEATNAAEAAAGPGGGAVKGPGQEMVVISI
jgi:hypothetical protein